MSIFPLSKICSIQSSSSSHDCLSLPPPSSQSNPQFTKTLILLVVVGLALSGLGFPHSQSDHITRQLKPDLKMSRESEPKGAVRVNSVLFSSLLNYLRYINSRLVSTKRESIWICLQLWWRVSTLSNQSSLLFSSPKKKDFVLSDMPLRPPTLQLPTTLTTSHNTTHKVLFLSASLSLPLSVGSVL